MITRNLFPLLRCPSCGSQHLYVTDQGLHCATCTTCYPIHPDYIDLMPRGVEFDYRSKYVTEEEELAEELDYHELAPPLLAAGVRNRTLRRLLNFQPHDIVLDNGCGNARFSTWNAEQVGLMIGSDPVTLFADAARAKVALVQADARVLPFADNTIDKAFSIDVLEHFPRPVIDHYLRETARVLRPGGQLLIFSNTREPSPIQPIINISRHIGKLFVRAGLYDFEREARRKSDHIKALETWEEVLEAFDQAGLRPVRTVFWNSLCTTLVEHVLMKLGEVVFGSGRTASTASTATESPPPPPDTTGSDTDTDADTGTAREIRARRRVRGSLKQRGAFYYAMQAVTLFMELDLWLFGWMRSGSYFLLVEKPSSIDTQPETATEIGR